MFRRRGRGGGGAATPYFADHGVRHLMVRPDFYVAFTARDGSELARRFDTVLQSIVSPEGALR